MTRVGHRQHLKCSNLCIKVACKLFNVINFRWTTSGCGDSRTHLQIKLMEDGSRQELARIEGPGSRCKSFWIQNPELSQDTISIFGRTDYPTWMQVVIASGMVAAKTQRRIDKSLQQQRM